MLLSSDQYREAPTYELLSAAALGQAGVDLRWIRAILDRGEACVPDLLRFLKEDREDDRIDIEPDVLAVARALQSPAAVPVLVEIARRNASDFPDGLIEAFREAGPAALEPLLELRRQVRDTWEVNSALAALGVRDPRILEALTEELERDPCDGAIVLSIYGDPAARPALEKALAAADDPAIRSEIESALLSIQEREPEPIEPYDPSADYPEEAHPSFALLTAPELMQFLRSPVASYRASAMRHLAFEELSPEMSALAFELARNDPDPAVRGACWEALADSDEPDIRRAMRERLADRGVPLEERCGALVGLAPEAQDQAIRTWFHELYDLPEARASVLKAMWHSGDRAFSEYFSRHLDDPDPRIQREAVLGAGHLGLVGEIGRLRRLFDREDVRDAALYAYALAAPLEPNRAAARQFLKKLEESAGGLSEHEALAVMEAIDARLEAAGARPAFESARFKEEEDPYVAPPKVGRNDPCPCGSGKKYKKCCGQ